MPFFRILFLFTLISIAIVSCNEDVGFNSDPDFRLTFSTDTISFDTLFTGFGSTTKLMKIYNPSTQKVNISQLYIENAESAYRINVNGIESNELRNVEIDPRDSLYVFVEVALDPKNQDAPRLLKDRLVIEINDNLQEVVLQTYAQDVYLIEGNITENEIWTGNRPYLVVKPVWLEEGTRLTLQDGTKVYFKKDAALHVKGDFFVNGTYQKPVVFASTRLEQLYNDVPGQWDGIYFYDESSEIIFSHFILEGGINGLIMNKTKLGNIPVKIEYGIIRNFTHKGISLSNSNFVGHDLLITNCGEECLSFAGNGSYTLFQSTLYNSWYFSPRSSTIVDCKGEGTVRIENSIVWGILTDELSLSSKQNVSVINSLLRLGNSKQSDYTSVFTDCIFNKDPKFINTNEIDFTLAAESPAINTGGIEFINGYPFDLAGNPRDKDEAPDMGTYEYTETK